MRRPHRTGWLAAFVVLLLALAGCGGPASPPRPTGELLIFAASPLTEVFTAIGEYLETENPGLRVSFRFGPSHELAQSLAAGDAADVFAAIGAEDMRLATGGATNGATGESAAAPATFARAQLVIAVAKGNPAGVAKLADLTRVRVAMCRPEAACGVASARVLDAADVTITPASTGGDTRDVLSQVVDGSADAGLVYRADARLADSEVDMVEFGESVEAVVDCHIMVLETARNPNAANLFASFVASEQARSVMSPVGFLTPSS